MKAVKDRAGNYQFNYRVQTYIRLVIPKVQAQTKKRNRNVHSMF